MHLRLCNLTVGAMMALASYASLLSPSFITSVLESHNMSRSSLGGAFDRFSSKAKDSLMAALPGRPEESAAASSASEYFFAIHVVDDQTNRGIPLVFLKTTYKAVYMTDSAGFVAFHEPGLMTGKPLWVVVSSYGYASPTGFLGAAGTQIKPTPGGYVEIRLKREQIAERLYRMTGYGIYRDTLLLREPTPLKNPVLNADVAGSDTIQCARFKGKLLWMWQDTDQMAFSLGNFAMTGATTDAPEHLDPEKGFDFDYYTTDGNPTSFTRAMIKLPLKQEGPIWVDGLTVVNDRAGRERLIAKYSVASQSLEFVEQGLVGWNEATETFDQRLAVFRDPRANTPGPGEHTIYVYDQGVRYAYYGKNVRVRADFESASDPSQYEGFTCLDRNGRARRRSNGALDWRWEKGARPISFDNTEALVRDSTLQPRESPYELVDVETNKHIVAAQMAIAWNPYLKLWVNIIQQKMGDTTAGEIWFSTANAPEGPWRHARKVTTHHMSRDDYKQNHNDLYNPVQHYELMRGGGRFVYFSGTLVNTFSGNQWPTPYYNYNNIMYRLDLADARLRLPSPPQGLWPTKPGD